MEFEFSSMGQETLIIGNGTEPYGLGDTLLLTSICKHATCIVELAPQAEKFASIFNGLAEVRIVENPVRTPHTGGGHYIRRKFRALNIDSDDILPTIIQTPERIEKAKALQLDKVVAFVPNCSLTWKNIREVRPDYWERYIAYLKENNVKIYQFGSSNNYTKFDGVDKVLLDLPIEELILHYMAIGTYVGVDTGDHHLMLACGGHNVVAFPSYHPGYVEEEWQYNSPVVQYIKI